MRTETQGQTQNISGVINAYNNVDSILFGDCGDTIIFSGQNGWNIGDLGIVVQMQGAVIDTSNTSTFGTITNLKRTGENAIFRVYAIGSNYIVTQEFLSSYFDFDGNVQIVKVPEYSSANVSGLLTCDPWNGSTGGILALSVRDTLMLNSNIDVSGKGFRGGMVSNNIYMNWYTGYYCTYASGKGGMKGEGISKISPSMAAGRGAPANAGGGGNDINTGGGGGGNYGPGGHGGNNYYAPGLLWGEGGRSIQSSQFSKPRLIMGGGGGGGHHNNTEGTSGGNGGGIIYLIAGSIIGNGYSILSKGNDVSGIAIRDGAGGGGAGGSIVVLCDTFLNSLNINVKGGKGGDQIYIPQCHGNGGGGGGGNIIKGSLNPFPGFVNTNVLGGNRGSGQCNATVNDAIDGGIGGVSSYIYDFVIGILDVDLGPDLSICEGDSILIGVPPQSGLSYFWNTGESTSQILVSPSDTTMFILMCQNTTQQCIRTEIDTVIINVINTIDPVINYFNTCNGMELQFEYNQLQGNSFLWSFGDGYTSNLSDPLHAYTNAGHYLVSLAIADVYGCVATWSDSVVVDNHNPPEAVVNYDIESCDKFVSFHSDTSFFNEIIWYISTGDTSSAYDFTYNFPTLGTFNVIVVATNDCGTDTAQITIEIDSALVSTANFISSQAQCSDYIEFYDNSSNASTWIWDFGDNSNSSIQNPIHNYAENGTYEVKLVVNPFTACSDSIIQIVSFDNGRDDAYFLPNAFTPNGDGINDYFEFYSRQQCDPVNISIFNRWGFLILSSYSTTLKWDGTYLGQPVASGVYYYKFESKAYIKYGSITLIR